jgi:nucleotide-binding universal stress UspA family protein
MFTKLLVPLDHSSFAEQALGPATAIAIASGANIDLVMVHEPRPLAGVPDVSWHAELIEAEDEYLAEIEGSLTKAAPITATHAVLPGDVVKAICRRIGEVSADLVVMTTHGRTGISRAWVGSVADGVLRKSGAPILMCRAGEKISRTLPFIPFRKILLLTDGSPVAMGVIPSAVSLAKATGARLSLLRIVQPVQLLTVETAIPFAFPLPAEDEMATERVSERAKKELVQIANDLAENNSIEVESHVLVAHNVAEAIIDYAVRAEVDAIAMSTHGRGASRLVLGSVADKVIRALGLPLLLRGPSAAPGRVDVAQSRKPQPANVV